MTSPLSSLVLSLSLSFLCSSAILLLLLRSNLAARVAIVVRIYARVFLGPHVKTYHEVAYRSA